MNKRAIFAVLVFALIISCANTPTKSKPDGRAPKETDNVYTIYCSGRIQGTVTITKELSGRIVVRVRYNLMQDGFLSLRLVLDSDICPLLTRSIVIVNGYTENLIIDGNITTMTFSSGSWEKTVVDGNITTRTRSDGSWRKQVVTKQGTSIFIETTATATWYDWYDWYD